MNFKLAWRNLWRNKRRTLITAASVFFAVIFAVFMMGIKEGMYDKMIDNMVGIFTGYAQVHADGYWDDQTLDNSFSANDALQASILSVNNVNKITPRIESFVLSASDSVTRGAMIVGIDPETEHEITNLKNKLEEGEYLEKNDKAVMIGKRLAEKLQLKLSDTIVVMGQGYHGSSAAGKYPIKGLLNFGSPELNGSVIYLPLLEAQWLFGTEGRITSYVLSLDDARKTQKVKRALEAQLGEAYEIMDWEELVPDLKMMIEGDRAEGYVFMIILYTIIAFGIFGTVLMMLAERRYEFGVMLSLGMSRFKLSAVVLIEMILIASIGAIAGMLGGFCVNLYFYLRPIRFGEEMQKIYEEYGIEPVLQASIDFSILYQQAIIVFVLVLIICIYPLIKLQSVKPVEAMRG